MYKVQFCLLALAITSAICIPIESSPGSKGLDRPSPINPDVISELPPVSAASSNVQKVPAKGTKLSSELPAEKKHKRDVEEAEETEETEPVKAHPTSTSRTSAASSSDDENDNSGPHFVRPVPVDQILQKIHSTTRHHHKIETTTASLESSTTEAAKTAVESHKLHKLKPLPKKEEPKEKKEEPKAKKEEQEGDDDSSKEDKSDE